MPENFYLQKYGFKPSTLTAPIASNTAIIVVIPCHNEPTLHHTLQALWQCDRPQATVEIIVVINHAEDAPPAVQEQNQTTLEMAQQWIEEHQDEQLRFHLLLEELPPKHAGVGLARKIGMDEAVARFHAIEHDGIIVCFDADCLCSTNYLTAIEAHFAAHPKTPGCAIRYAHPLEGNKYPAPVYEGIVQYELFLRYYNQALRYTGFPFAYHTVGSSMAVRASVYQKQGGMNKRKAGEDFYFLNKIIELGNFSELNTATVIPSPRVSDRVPFGTGKAIGEWLTNETGIYTTYHPDVFEVLKRFFALVPQLYNGNLPSLEKPLQAFLQDEIEDRLLEIKRNSSSVQAFTQRFFRWFNAFKILKFVHFARDEYYANIPLLQAVNELMERQHKQLYNSAHEALVALRELEGQGSA